MSTGHCHSHGWRFLWRKAMLSARLRRRHYLPLRTGHLQVLVQLLVAIEMNCCWWKQPPQPVRHN